MPLYLHLLYPNGTLTKNDWSELSGTLTIILTFTIPKGHACQIILLDYNGTLAKKDWLELSGMLANILTYTIPKWHAFLVISLDYNGTLTKKEMVRVESHACQYTYIY